MVDTSSVHLFTGSTDGPVTPTVRADRCVAAHRALTEATGYHFGLRPLGSVHGGSGCGQRPEHTDRPESQPHEDASPGGMPALAHEHRSPDRAGQPKRKHTWPIQIKMSAPDVLHIPPVPGKCGQQAGAGTGYCGKAKAPYGQRLERFTCADYKAKRVERQLPTQLHLLSVRSAGVFGRGQVPFRPTPHLFSLP
jgi:hypothetical protein